jgi:hypothetical protein
VFPHVILGKHLGVALTVKKNAYGLTLAFALLFSAAVGLLLVDSAKANGIPLEWLPAITINSDGSITPQTDYISRNGNVYTLTADIVDEYYIDVWCSNIVFDGAGHTIRSTKGDNPCLFLHGVNNATVKNIALSSTRIDVSLARCNYLLINKVKTTGYLTLFGSFNVITESNINLRIKSGSESNLISRNNITTLDLNSNSNNFSKNNFLCGVDGGYTNLWDNDSVGNYWSDYAVRYPNASEIGNTGIGDTPYVIDEDNIDYYPLMCPYDIERDAIAFPARTPFPLFFVAAVSAVSIAGAAAGLFYRHNKHSRSR